MLLANMALVVCAPWGFHQAPGSTNRAVYVKLWSYSPFWRCTLFRRLDGLVEEERLSNILYLGDCALEVKRFGKNDLENLWTISFCMAIKAEAAYLLDIDAVACAAEDEAGFHCARETLGLGQVSGGFGLDVSLHT
jgi:hypothetical protein